MVTSREEAELVLGKGYSAIAFSGDLWIYQQALAAGVSAVRALSKAAEAAR